jgi:hypothetical protein
MESMMRCTMDLARGYIAFGRTHMRFTTIHAAITVHF